MPIYVPINWRRFISEQNRKSEAEVVLRSHWAANPTDEDTLCFLMTLLSTQGRYQEALQLYEQTRRAFEEDGLEVAASTTTLVLHLQDELLGREGMLNSFPKTIDAGNVTACDKSFQALGGTIFYAPCEWKRHKPRRSCWDMLRCARIPLDG